MKRLSRWDITFPILILAHETERAAIANAGDARTFAEHTYAKRFQEIFARIGLA